MQVTIQYKKQCDKTELFIEQVENTVRWRYAMDKEGNIMTDDMGQSMKESNARVVRWSDGRYYIISVHIL